ncbi:MAG: hypothetical protein SPL46_07395 [Selenomonadaceae bacterium]|uniref:phage tail assembly chaperone n=1 Tax=Selenomonas bovis TaxID=416586 RepID=UPI00037694D5|nr:hypothetical protein [Selenomonas bovis]MDY6299799.1 hypothetical protein [Selenomonadaceae bacterium]
MAAVSIEELINEKEAIEARKKRQYDVETSAGTFTMRPPSKSFVAEAMGLSEGSDEYLVYHCTVSPDLSDKKLQDAYGCVEPTDIVDRLLDPGEISAVAKKIMQCAGYGKDVRAELHEEVKN